ncbi:MAG TPA: transcription antitermination factor NusB [Lunatimonas sp.]|nr:transcription antitermination factor NusB [Lunatimonas sp.]
MLNRRILRVKAFQSLYAYHQCKTSNFNLARDFIKDSFLPDLNSMEVQDKVQLKKDADTCFELFVQNLASHNLVSSSDISAKIKNVANLAVKQYHKTCDADLTFLRNNMITAAERIPELYLYAIGILMAFGDHVGKESEKRKKFSQGSMAVESPGEDNLSKNKVLVYLQTESPINSEFIRHHVHLDDWKEEIKQWFRDYVKPLEEYQQYIQIINPSFEEDQEVAQAILKKVIFKNDTILSFFHELDLNWTENKPVVRSLALKVLKNIDLQQPMPAEFLPELAINWEDDREFFKNIFNLTVDSEAEYSDLIAVKAKNWDIDRIALTDKVILSMALTEMVNFTSIPVKVTINEYIDISKTYSTPKSKQFVNGLLDVLAKELTDSGKIRKSGRGLIDNK